MANNRGRSKRPYRNPPSASAGAEPLQRVVQGAGQSTPSDEAVTEPRSQLVEVLAYPGAALIILRAFLGVTFVFAGLQKLANADFFGATGPASFRQHLRASILTSPLHHLLSPALHASTLVAVVISLGELAVGIGTLLGLFGRIAAVGGLLLSLLFFLTVSFNDNPYYYGADIVFLFAWTPFVIAGSGAWSLDAIYARRLEQARAGVQIAASRGGRAVQRRAAEIERRAFLQRTSSAGIAGFSMLVLGGLVAGIGRLVQSPPQSSRNTLAGRTGTNVTASSSASNGASPNTSAVSPSSSGNAPKGTLIGSSRDVPIGGAASFTDPAQGIPALVIQARRGEFRAFTAVCPHAGCQVGFDPQNKAIVCPCHGSIFNATTGAVELGPAVTGLQGISIALGPNNELYVDG